MSVKPGNVAVANQTDYQVGQIGGRFLVYKLGVAVASFATERDADNWISLERESKKAMLEFKKIAEGIKDGSIKPQEIPF